MLRILLLPPIIPPVAIILGYFISNRKELFDSSFWDAPAIFAAVYLVVATAWIILVI